MVNKTLQLEKKLDDMDTHSDVYVLVSKLNIYNHNFDMNRLYMVS